MKRNYFFALFLLFAFVPFASAQYFGGGFWYGTEQVIDSIVRNLEPLLRALLGGYDWGGYLLFEKTLLFVLISIIVGLILEKIPVFENVKSKKILRLISVIIGVLAVRNLNYIWVGTIIVQYQVLFISIAGILPFMIYWYFVNSIKKEDSWLRKLAWIFYAVIYFGLWATTDLQAYEEVYLWGAIVALVYAFVFDSMVYRWLVIQEAKRGDTARRDHLVGTLKKEIREIQDLIGSGNMAKHSGDHLVKVKQDLIKSLMR